MWNLNRNDSDEPTYKTDSQIMNLWSPVRGRDS